MFDGCNLSFGCPLHHVDRATAVCFEVAHDPPLVPLLQNGTKRKLFLFRIWEIRSVVVSDMAYFTIKLLYLSVPHRLRCPALSAAR